TTIAPRRVRQRTLESYESAVRRHLVPGIGRHRLDRLRPEHLDQLYTAMLAAHYSPATVLRQHRDPVPRAHRRHAARPRLPQHRHPGRPARPEAERRRHRPGPRRGPRRAGRGRARPELGPLDSRPRPGSAAVRGAGPAVEGHRPAHRHPHGAAQHPPGPRRWPDLRGAEDPAEPAHPRPTAAPGGRPAPAQGGPARRTDARRRRLARRGPGLRPAQRPADRREDRLRRLDPAAAGRRRPARAAARRPAHRRHPAAERERPPAGGHGAARPQPDAHDHGHLQPCHAGPRPGSRRPDERPAAARWSHSNCNHNCNQTRLRPPSGGRTA
ncbi:MAG: Integrase, partial [Blastococcus sp.]|nr:Integrase [Blastococcus sp.]